MPSRLEEVIERNRRALLAREGPLVRQLTRDYQRAIRTLDRLITQAAERAADIIADGGDPFAALLNEQRLRALQAQARIEMNRVGTSAAGAVRERQRAALFASIENARSAMGALEMGVRLNSPVAERVWASFSPDSPVARLFRGLSVDAAQRAREVLVDGVTLGRNPRQIASSLRSSLNGDLARALTISRTETLRAYRAGTLETYRENPRVLDGWQWISALDERTCIVCIMMHGEVFGLDEPFGSHPNCRCSAAPHTRIMPPEITPGENVFETWSEPRQMQTLGPAKFDAYKAGALDLRSLVGTGNHPDWGPVRFERSLAAVLGQQRATGFYR